MNRRTANLWLLVVVLAGLVPPLGLSVYWASSQGSRLLDLPGEPARRCAPARPRVWGPRAGGSTTRWTGGRAGGGGRGAAGPAATAGYARSRNRAAVYVPAAARRPANPDARTVYQDDWVRHLAQVGAHYYA